MAPLPRDLLRRGTGVPTPFRTAFEEEVRRFSETPLGAQLRIGLDNSLAMSSYVTQVGDSAVIVIDWARIERLLCFTRFFWRRVGQPLFTQHLVSYLEREVALIAARKAAAMCALVSARDYHRAYRSNAFAAALDCPPDLDEQIASAVLIGRALVLEQCARAVLASEPEAAERHLRDMPDRRRFEGVADDRLREDLFVDSYVLEQLTRLDPEGAAQGLLGSLALMIAYSEIENALEAMAPAFDGFSERLGDAIRAELERDHEARLVQLETSIRTAAGEHEDESFGRFLEKTANWIALLRRVVGDVFVSGFEVLHTFFWDGPDNLRRRTVEVMGGLSTEGQAAILEALCASDADSGYGSWARLEAAQPHVPAQVEALLPQAVLLPGSGRPEVKDWRSRLGDPSLRSVLDADLRQA